MDPHTHIRSLYVPMPEATALWPVQTDAGRFRAAGRSPKGAHASFEAAHQEAV